MQNIKNLIKNNIFIVIIIIIIVVVAVIVYLKSDNKQDMQNIFEQVENDESINNVENDIKEEIKEIAIHITGEVKKTGIIYLKEGLRIADAIEKAGGTTKNADLSKINLAYVLQDGQKIHIPGKNDKTDNYITESTNQGNLIDDSSNKKKKIININTATKDELQNLSGIGPSLAEKIIEYRNSNGKFKKIEEIKNVSGIGENKYKNIKDNISI